MWDYMYFGLEHGPHGKPVDDGKSFAEHVVVV